MPPGKIRTSGLLKAAILLAFIAGAVIVLRFTPAGSLFSAEKLNGLIQSAGPFGPLVFILVYAAAVCLFIPGTLLTAIGAAIFGPFEGFAWAWTGAMLGAALAFLIARYLGRDTASAIVGERLRKYDEAIERNGFATVLYLRLVYFPFTPMNFGMGLTGVRFVDYILGTALGIMVGTFVFTFFIGTLKEVIASGRWEMLAGWRTGVSAGLFVVSFFIPKLVKKIRGEGQGEEGGGH